MQAATRASHPGVPSPGALKPRMVIVSTRLMPRGSQVLCVSKGSGWWGPTIPALQAMRTPSRDEAGLQLLKTYYSQLCFLDMRFFSPARSPVLLFQW